MDAKHKKIIDEYQSAVSLFESIAADLRKKRRGSIAEMRLRQVAHELRFAIRVTRIKAKHFGAEAAQ